MVLHRIVDGRQGGTVSLSTIAVPEGAKRAYEKAGKEFSKGKPNLSNVTKELEKAVEIYPEFAAAWFMLGGVRKDLDNRSGAREAFEQAIAANSQYVSPYLGLLQMAIEEKRWEQADQLSNQALELSPNHISIHYLKAQANSNLGRIDVAERSALRVKGSSEAQKYPLIHYILGWIMSEKGDFHSAAVEYRRLLEIQPTTGLSERLREQLADWERQGLIQMSQN
jgi:tetratricopeptide (TPR) repeat protein